MAPEPRVGPRLVCVCTCVCTHACPQWWIKNKKDLWVSTYFVNVLKVLYHHRPILLWPFINLVPVDIRVAMWGFWSVIYEAVWVSGRHHQGIRNSLVLASLLWILSSLHVQLVIDWIIEQKTVFSKILSYVKYSGGTFVIFLRSVTLFSFSFSCRSN